jgi:hypothetical protein
MDGQQLGIGALPRTPDRRDFKLGLSQAPVQVPAVYMPDRSNIPKKFQGKWGTCGGHAGAMFVSILENLDLSPKYLWKQIKKIDNWKQNGWSLNDGTDIRSIFKALQNTGVCHEALCPDNLQDSIEQYSDPAALTDPMLNDAYPHGVTSYAFTESPSWEQLRQAIFQTGAVVARLDIGDGWWVNGWSEAATCPLKLGNKVGGHFVTLWGYDQSYIYFRNSWGTDWGRNGDGYFGRDYLPYVTEIGVGIDGPSIKQQLVFKYQSLIVQLQKLLSLKSS